MRQLLHIIIIISVSCGNIGVNAQGYEDKVVARSVGGFIEVKSKNRVVLYNIKDRSLPIVLQGVQSAYGLHEGYIYVEKVKSFRNSVYHISSSNDVISNINKDELHGRKRANSVLNNIIYTNDHGSVLFSEKYGVINIGWNNGYLYYFQSYDFYSEGKNIWVPKIKLETSTLLKHKYVNKPIAFISMGGDIYSINSDYTVVKIIISNGSSPKYEIIKYDEKKNKPLKHDVLYVAVGKSGAIINYMIKSKGGKMKIVGKQIIGKPEDKLTQEHENAMKAIKIFMKNSDVPATQPDVNVE